MLNGWTYLVEVFLIGKQDIEKDRSIYMTMVVFSRISILSMVHTK